MIKAEGAYVAGVTEAAESLIRDRGGGDQATTARAGHFGAGESGGDAVAGMPGFLRGVAIVEIQVANHHPVGECGQLGAAGQPAADDGYRPAMPGNLCRQVAGDFARFRGVTANGASHGVNDHSLEKMNGIGRDVAKVQIGRVIRYVLGYGSHRNPFWSPVGPASVCIRGEPKPTPV